MTRMMNKRTRRRKSRLGRTLISLALAVVLIVFGVWYAKDYARKALYRRYPLNYKEQIMEAAAAYSLEPEHIAAVICCESGFNPMAESNVGARGLMQIMPETGEWIALRIGEGSSFTIDQLYDAETNLRYGCWYLRWLSDRYGGDTTLISAAYFAGQGSVDGWLQNPAYSADGQSLTTMPTDATANYVKKIATACEKYEEMYDFTTPTDSNP